MTEAPGNLLYINSEELPITYIQDEEGNLFVQTEEALLQGEEAESNADAEFVSEQPPPKKYTLLSVALSNSVDLDVPSDKPMNQAKESVSAPAYADNPYDAPPDPTSPYSFRAFNSLKDVQEIIQRMQDSIGVKFTVCKKGANFGIEENWNISQIDTDQKHSNFRILFQWSNHERSTTRFALPCVPFDGVPFMSVSHVAHGCEHLSVVKDPLALKCQQVREYRRRVEAGEIVLEDEDRSPDSDVAKKKGLKRKICDILPPGVQRYRETKKNGCNAVLTVKQVACFPDYAIPPTMQADRKTMHTIATQLRSKMTEGSEDVSYQMRYYVRIPNTWAHTGHEIQVQHPKYISQSFRERVMNYFTTLKEREILSDIKFNVQGQRHHMKLHSAVLACCGVRIRDLLVRQDYAALADMLEPLNKGSLDAFFRFAYSGHLDVTPEVNLDALESVFNEAGIKEGAEQCAQHRTNPQAITINNWTLTTQSKAVKRPLQPCKKQKADPTTGTESVQQQARSIFQTLCSLFTSDNSDEWCSRIADILQEEGDTQAIIKRVVSERLDHHTPLTLAQGERSAEATQRTDKATCTENTNVVQTTSVEENGGIHSVPCSSPVKRSVVRSPEVKVYKVNVKDAKIIKVKAKVVKLK